MERLRIGDVPVLVAARAAAAEAARRGTVLLYHPLGQDKGMHEEDLERLAALGFLAVGVDAIAHGERRVADGWARFRANPMRALLEVVTATAAEVPGLVDALVRRGWAHAGRVAVAGVSLGGFVAYGAVALEPRLAAAVCINASPTWGDDPRSPHLHLDRFAPPLALLSVTGSADALVPPEHARALHEALAPRWAAAPERLRYVELAGEPHHMSAAGLARARDEAERWLARFVPGAEAAAR